MICIPNCRITLNYTGRNFKKVSGKFHVFLTNDFNLEHQKCTEEFKILVETMLREDPSERFNIEALLNKNSNQWML